jgi:hypothetical protein
MYLQYAHQKRKSNGCLMMDGLYWKLFRSLLYVRHSDIEQIAIVSSITRSSVTRRTGFARTVQESRAKCRVQVKVSN